MRSPVCLPKAEWRMAYLISSEPPVGVGTEPGVWGDVCERDEDGLPVGSLEVLRAHVPPVAGARHLLLQLDAGRLLLPVVRLTPPPDHAVHRLAAPHPELHQSSHLTSLYE